MALNTLKCNHLAPLGLKGLTHSPSPIWNNFFHFCLSYILLPVINHFCFEVLFDTTYASFLCFSWLFSWDTNIIKAFIGTPQLSKPLQPASPYMYFLYRLSLAKLTTKKLQNWSALMNTYQ